VIGSLSDASATTAAKRSISAQRIVPVARNS